MGARSVIRILLVENDQEWRDSVTRALPTYQVDAASTYDDALRLMAEGARYEVAIVDLNLIDSADRNAGDLLGGEVLLQLRRDHPATRRIALTAWPPGAVRGQVLDRYGVDELLIKSHLTLSGLREVVEFSLERSASSLPAQARARLSALEDNVRTWYDVRISQLDQQRRILLNEMHISRENARVSDQLRELERRRAELESAFKDMEATVAGIDGGQDINAVTLEIKTRQDTYDRPGQS